MWFRRLRVFIVLVTQLACFSQAIVAAQLPCAAMHQHTKHIQSAASRVMAHSHPIQVNNASADEMSPCCEHKQCAKTHCASVGYAGAAVVDSYTQLPVQLAGVQITEYAVFSPSSEPASLFRPPNFR